MKRRTLPSIAYHNATDWTPGVGLVAVLPDDDQPAGVAHLRVLLPDGRQCVDSGLPPSPAARYSAIVYDDVTHRIISCARGLGRRQPARHP